MNNPLTKAIVFGGLEPFEQFKELERFLFSLRRVFGCDDDVVIYTGYRPEELSHELNILSGYYNNIIVKFGRFVPNSQHRFDEVLGVELASDNQYAVKIC